MEETFRTQWKDLCDYVCTFPHRTVTWYESDAHRLRLTADPATGAVRLYMAMANSWKLIDSAVWPVLEPRVLRHRARCALITERDKRFPERVAEPAEAVMGCRPGRLRTVNAREQCA